MASNVEIKTKVPDLNELRKKVENLDVINDGTLIQTDIYFNVQSGRMKMRQTVNKSTELIFYDRPNEEGPKLSKYWKQTFLREDEAEGLKELLKHGLGVRGIVKKERWLYRLGQTRIHLDNVEGLGQFLEFEVVLSPDDSLENGQRIAFDLLDRLEIPREGLISWSYIDLLSSVSNQQYSES